MRPPWQGDAFRRGHILGLPRSSSPCHVCSGELRELRQRVLEAPGAAPPWRKLLGEVDDPSFLGRYRRPPAVLLHDPYVISRLLLDCVSSQAVIRITIGRCSRCSQNSCAVPSHAGTNQHSPRTHRPLLSALHLPD